MKKTLTILLVLCLMFTSLFSLPVFAEGETTFAMTELEGKYKTQGRTIFNADGVLLAHYPATGIEFNAYCSGDVYVTFTAYELDSSETNCYFTVIVDGETMPRSTCHITETGDVTVKIAEGLEEGNHTFKLYRQNEIKFAHIGFKSITLDGEILSAPEAKDMYIEFVGASQWGGAGNLGDKNSEDFDTPDLQDATQGLTYITPQLLDADWSVISMAGTGAYWGLQLYPMNKLYNYYGYVHDDSTASLYDFDNTRKPDYIVIGLGTNDVDKAEKFGKTDEDIYEAFNYFFRLLRMKNPNAKIIWAHGMLNDHAEPYIKKAVEDLGGADYGVYELAVTKNNDGAKLHPSVEGHQVIAEELTAFIESLEAENAPFKSKFEQKPYSPLSDGEVIMESDFNDADGTNWQKYQASYITYMDDNGDGTNDFARITSTANATPALLSAPFKLVQGKKYELSFWARIPEGSTEFFTDTYKLYPKIALYKPTLNGDKVNSTYQESKNDYVYKNNDFTDSVWQFGSELYEYTKPKYTVIGNTDQFYAYGYMDTDVIYEDWIRVTYNFTGISADGSTEPQDVAVSFALPKAKDSLAEAVGCMYDIKDVKLVDTSVDTGSDDTTTETKTILTSEFEKGDQTNWQGTKSNVQFSNEDGVSYARVNSSSSQSGAGLVSSPFELIPGNEYELRFDFRIPAESNSYLVGGSTFYAPSFFIYEPKLNSTGTKVASIPSIAATSTANNLYAYSYTDNDKEDENGDTSFKRRPTFSAEWQVGTFDTVKKEKYSHFAYSDHKKLLGAATDSKSAYSQWTTVTAKFTAVADEDGETSQISALGFNYLDLKKDGYIFDIKDVTLTETSVKTEEPEVPETPEEPEPEEPEYVEPVAPENAVFFESFENATDESAATLITNVDSWVTANVVDTEYATGRKSLALKAYYQYVFIPIDKTLLTAGKTYEFSMDWKLKEYTSDKKRKISKIAFVGYNPSKGETINKDFLESNGVYTYKENLNGTGNWEHLTLRFGSSDYNYNEQYGIVLRYVSSTPYSAAEDTMYIDNMAIAPAKDEAITKYTLNEDERTDDTVKVLAIGNSFALNSVAWLTEIAKADGKDLRAGYCHISGCSLQRHYANIFNGSSDKYSFGYNTKNGKIYPKNSNNKNVTTLSLQEALILTDWDYITLQQASASSFKYDTYEPFLTELIDYIKEMCPDAKIVLNETWAYPDDSSMMQGQPGFDTDGDGNSEEDAMFAVIRENYLKASQTHGFLPMIPVGEAINKARDAMNRNLSNDGHHVDDRGRLIAGLMWYEFFTGVSALDNKVDLTDNSIFTYSDDRQDADGNDLKGTPLNITAEEQQIMKTIAHETVVLYKKANETQLAIEAIGTVTEESGETIAKAEALRTELNADYLLPNLQTLIDARTTYDSLVPKVIPGDFDGTGVADLEDVTLLARHFAGWDTGLDESVLDLNGDGVQNLKDLVLLAQFVAGWDVELVK